MTEDEQIRQRILDNELILSQQNLKYNQVQTWNREQEEVWKAKVHIMTEVLSALIKAPGPNFELHMAVERVAQATYLILKEVGETPAAIEIDTEEARKERWRLMGAQVDPDESTD